MDRDLNFKKIIRSLISVGEYKLVLKLILNEYRAVRILHEQERFNRKCNKLKRHIKEANDQVTVVLFKTQLDMFNHPQN